MRYASKPFIALALLLTASAPPAQTTQLKVATISAGAARLDNGSLVNIGQPLVGVFGSPQAGIVGSAGIMSALRRPLPPEPPMFASVRWNPLGNIRLSFQATPGWTYGIEASTNLVDWVSLWMTNSSDTTILFEDVDAVRYDRRFYRVVPY